MIRTIPEARGEDRRRFQRMEVVLTSQPGDALVEQPVALGGRLSGAHAVVERGVAGADALIPRRETLRIAQVQHGGRQPQAGAGDRIGGPEVRERVVGIVRLPQSSHPQRQRLRVLAPIERRT